MTTCKTRYGKHRQVRNDTIRRDENVPLKPDRRLWETDKERAFEAGVRWFLALSRNA
jgi:hypothetical protein